MPMLVPNEGDWECAYRVLKHCHPADHEAGAMIVAQHRLHALRELRVLLIKAYVNGHVQELIDSLSAI